MPAHANASTLVLIPAHNEESTVGEVVQRASRLGYRTCVIDDGSNDATARIAEHAGATVLRHEAKVGRGAALRSGFAYASCHGYERVVAVDGDGQHDVRDIAVLLLSMDVTGSDLVIGSRFTHPLGTYRIGRPRRLAMRLVTSRVQAVTHTRFTDTTSGFCAISSPLLDEFATSYPSFFLSDTAEVLVRAHVAGWHISETPVRMTRRRVGRSKTGVIKSLICLLVVLVRIERLRWDSTRASASLRPPSPLLTPSPESG